MPLPVSTSERDIANLIDEILEIDRLVLPAHTIASGGSFDLAVHRARLEQSIPKSTVVAVRRKGQLVAYGNMWPKETEGDWFVSGLAAHPAHRNPSVFRELRRAMIELLKDHGVRRLESHVYRANRASMALHRRLGFSLIQEAPYGVAFQIEVGNLKV